jgi:tRNA threonylcarbamoyladenosine biosynthesis protein TsaE
MSAGASNSRSLRSPRATHELGRRIGEACRGGERIRLEGELGAGKTAFTRGLAEGLGLDPASISSPTFTILHEHADGRGGLRLVHADLYRVGDPEELEALGWQELVDDPRTVLAVEWPDRVPGVLEDHDLTVRLDHGPDPDSRHAELISRATSSHLRVDDSRPCPSCSKAVAIDDPQHPFCSDRCRLADLGNWFNGGYAISRDIEEDDLVDPEFG